MIKWGLGQIQSTYLNLKIFQKYFKNINKHLNK